MKTFQIPEIELIKFDVADVITTSDDLTGDLGAFSAQLFQRRVCRVHARGAEHHIGAKILQIVVTGF